MELKNALAAGMAEPPRKAARTAAEPPGAPAAPARGDAAPARVVATEPLPDVNEAIVL